MGGCCCDATDRHLPTVVMDNFIRRLISPPTKKIARFIRPGSTVADLGCGPGYFTIAIAELLGPNGRVYAADSDPKVIRVLQSKAEAGGFQRVIDARVTSAAEMKQIPDASVDFVFANGVLCCMVDHKGALAEIKRILKRTGVAYLSVAKGLRRNDVRAVRKGEWEQMLDDFRVSERHDGLLHRWALVSLRQLATE